MLASPQNQILLAQEFHTAGNTGLSSFNFSLFWFICNVSEIKSSRSLRCVAFILAGKSGRGLAIQINLGHMASSRSFRAVYWDLVSENKNKQIQKGSALRLFAIPKVTLLVRKEKIFVRQLIMSWISTHRYWMHIQQLSRNCSAMHCDTHTHYGPALPYVWMWSC